MNGKHMTDQQKNEMLHHVRSKRKGQSLIKRSASTLCIILTGLAVYLFVVAPAGSASLRGVIVAGVLTLLLEVIKVMFQMLRWADKNAPKHTFHVTTSPAKRVQDAFEETTSLVNAEFDRIRTDFPDCFVADQRHHITRHRWKLVVTTTVTVSIWQ